MKKAGLVLGVISFILFYFFIKLDHNPFVSRMAAIASIMAIWWITEAVPLAVTSLIPVVLFPVTGIEKGEVTAATYFNSTIFLFFGGFLLALAMEKWNLHKRLALKIIIMIGGSPERIIFGFMTATAFISMWISNTATAVMMLPLAISIILQLEEMFNKTVVKNFSIALMLGVAYSCSIGGVATIIGTPPNLSFIRILHIIFPAAPEISFGTWIIMIFPLTVILLVSAWLLLCKVIFRIDKSIQIKSDIIKTEHEKLGAMKDEENIVAVIFVITALLWIFRSNLDFGSFTIPGWSNLFGNPDYLNDGTVAVFIGIILFLIPAKSGGRILEANTISKIPWDIILLFGGGFALAKGFIVSGLSEYIGTSFSGLTVHPLWSMVIVAIVVTFLTELTSNTATAEMILPILASISVALGINPLFLMVTGTISASMAFMLPVATPPNAVVFGSKRVKVRDMALAGFFMNWIGIVAVTLIIYFYGSIILNIDIIHLPSWAVSQIK